MAVEQFNLREGQRAERKTLITVAEWHLDQAIDVYVPQASEPSDWSTNYTDYYTKVGNSYVAVTGASAPTWSPNTYYTKENTDVMREFLGVRTEDSSIEYNAEIETTTDILGNNYSDMQKTQPEQSFDPSPVIGGARLKELLNDIRRRNALSELQQFNIYIITAFVGDSTSGYAAERHEDCSITYDSFGGDVNVNFPFTVHFSNKITTGIVDVLNPYFHFTADQSI